MRIRQTIKTSIRFGLGITVVMLAMLACKGGDTNSTENTDDYYTYTDDYNRTVKVPNNPKRIVSISPAITEVIYALGADDKLVGRTDFCNYPPQVDSVESIGGISNFSIEKLLALKPDLVLIGSMVNENTVNLMTNAGITLVTVREKDNFEALFDNIEKIGLLCGHHNEALHLNDSLRQKVQEVTTHIDTSASNKPTVYYVVGYGKGGNFTAGGNTFINDIFKLCGLRNIAEDITGWNYSVEALLEADPDYIIIRREDMATFMNTKPYTYLSAVKQGRVIPIESAYIDLQVPRNVDGLVYIYNSIDIFRTPNVGKHNIQQRKKELLAISDTNTNFFFSNDTDLESQDPHAYRLMNRMLQMIIDLETGDDGWAWMLATNESIKQYYQQIGHNFHTPDTALKAIDKLMKEYSRRSQGGLNTASYVRSTMLEYTVIYEYSRLIAMIDDSTNVSSDDKKLRSMCYNEYCKWYELYNAKIKIMSSYTFAGASYSALALDMNQIYTQWLSAKYDEIMIEQAIIAGKPFKSQVAEIQKSKFNSFIKDFKENAKQNIIKQTNKQRVL